jgi:hypothetical protein
MSISSFAGSGADVVTGERIFPGELVVDTGFNNVPNAYMSDTLTRFLKEDTIVWLAEQAGYDLVKRDAGDSGDTEGVDGSDAGVGGGEDPVGAVTSGGRKASK